MLSVDAAQGTGDGDYLAKEAWRKTVAVIDDSYYSASWSSDSRLARMADSCCQVNLWFQCSSPA